MKTLDQFKQELGVTVIKFMKSAKTGREFTTIGEKNIILSSKVDKTKPLFAFYNEDKKFYVVCNSTLVAGSSL